jgi:hypothetical protein
VKPAPYAFEETTMQTYVARYATAAWVWKMGAALQAGAAWLRASAQRLDGWLAAREKAASDADALCAMSERELRDIGIDPGRNRGAAGDAWARDWVV